MILRKHRLLVNRVMCIFPMPLRKRQTQQPPVIAPMPAVQGAGGGYAYAISGDYETSNDFCQFCEEVD